MRKERREGEKGGRERVREEEEEEGGREGGVREKERRGRHWPIYVERVMYSLFRAL